MFKGHSYSFFENSFFLSSPLFHQFSGPFESVLVLEETLGLCLLPGPLPFHCFRSFCCVSFFPCGHTHRSRISSGSESWLESLSLQYTQVREGPSLVFLASACGFSVTSQPPVSGVYYGVRCELRGEFYLFPVALPSRPVYEKARLAPSDSRCHLCPVLNFLVLFALCTLSPF